MTAKRVSLPRLDKWANHDQIAAFLTAVNPHWDVDEDVTLDFRQCSFLSAEGAALLAAFKLYRARFWSATDIDWDTPTTDIKKQLGRWKLTEMFGRERFRWVGNAIPLLHQPQFDAAKLWNYICEDVCSAQNMPSMSPELTDEVQRTLFELFQNIFQHAGSQTGGIAIGQLYPVAKQVQVCVCDTGLGVVRKIKEAGLAQADSPSTLEWALGQGNTTRRPENGQPGGLGLYLLQEFVKINGGSLRIVSNDGYLCQTAGKLTRQTLPVELAGTLIQLKLNVRDDVTYTFTQ